MNLFILCKIHELGKVRLNDTKLANNEYKLDIFFFFFIKKKKKTRRCVHCPNSVKPDFDMAWGTSGQ